MAERSADVAVIVIPAALRSDSGANDLIRVAKREILGANWRTNGSSRDGCHGFSEMEPSV